MAAQDYIVTNEALGFFPHVLASICDHFFLDDSIFEWD